jgi:hypothetical protein
LIYVVNWPFWPFAVDVKPRQSMCGVLFAANTNVPIALGSFAPWLITWFAVPPPHFLRELAGGGIVMQQGS